jgi:hypothetical protein
MTQGRNGVYAPLNVAQRTRGFREKVEQGKHCLVACVTGPCRLAGVAFRVWVRYEKRLQKV